MTRKRSPYRPRHVGLHRAIAAGAEHARRATQADEIARPMRAMFSMLASGEVFEVQGRAAMDMPELDPSLRQANTDWVEIAPALRGWIDLWAHIAPDLRTYHLGVLADCLDQWRPITPRLVEQARAEFEACVERIPALPPGKIKRGILTTQIGWEVEKLSESQKAAGA